MKVRAKWGATWYAGTVGDEPAELPGRVLIDWDEDDSFTEIKRCDVEIDAAATPRVEPSDRGEPVRPRKRRCARSAASRTMIAAMRGRSRLQPLVLEAERTREVYGKEVSDEQYHDQVVSYQEDEGHTSMVEDKARNGFYRQAMGDQFRRDVRGGVARRRCGKKKSAAAARRQEELLICDVGCGPTLLLTRLAANAYAGSAQCAAAKARQQTPHWCGIDIGEGTCAQARGSLRHDPVGGCSNAVVEVMHADAARGKGRALVATSDVLVHEVFGMLASIEGFTRWARLAKRALVVPDTSATLFQLVDYSNALLAFPKGVHIGERVAIARVAFEQCTGLSADVGVLELFEGGGEVGGAAKWGDDQRHESTFRIRTSGALAALGCFIALGHGDSDGDCGGGGGASGSGGASPSRARRAQPKRPFALRGGGGSDAAAAAVPMPMRKHWTTSDARDAKWASSNWKNVLILLPRSLIVQEGDCVRVVATVVGLNTKVVKYQCTVTLYRGGVQIGGSLALEVTQRDIFPWWKQKE